MSFAAPLLEDLDDVVFLMEQITESVCAPHLAQQTPALVERLIAKDALFEKSLSRLVRHHTLARQIAELKSEILAIDEQFVGFSDGLVSLESELHECIYADTASHTRPLDLPPDPLPQERVASAHQNALMDGVDSQTSLVDVDSILALAQRVALFSRSAADHDEKRGNSIARPPIPQENELALALLRNQPSIDELEDLVQKQKELMQSQQLAAAAAEAKPVQTDAAAAAGAAGGELSNGTSESGQNRMELPSFASLSATAGLTEAWRIQSQFDYSTFFGSDEDDNDDAYDDAQQPANDGDSTATTAESKRDDTMKQ